MVNLTKHRIGSAIADAASVDMVALRDRNLDDLRGVSPSSLEILRAHWELEDLTGMFADLVWLDHLRDFWDEARENMRGIDDKRIMQVAEGAGCVFVTLYDKHARVSDESIYGGAFVQFRQDDGPFDAMQYCDVRGDLDDVRRLIRDVIEIGPRVLETRGPQ